MGTYRALSADDVRSILAAFGLHDYCGHVPIAAGTINTNVKVLRDRGPLFLRINEGKPRVDVEREVAIVEHLAARGVNTPLPLKAKDGLRFVPFVDAFASLFPWVDGRTLSRTTIGPKEAASVGAALASLHLAGRDFPDRRPGRYEPDAIARRLQDIAARNDAQPDAALAAALAILRPELEAVAALRDPDVPEGVIHGDLFIDNVLYDDAGEVAALLDFEQASWGRLGYDLAVAVLAFGFGTDDFRPQVTRALLDAYVRVRPLDSTEKAVFFAELRFAACRFATTRITDVYLRRDAGAPQGKDFRRYLARLHCVKARVAARDRLLLP